MVWEKVVIILLWMVVIGKVLDLSLVIQSDFLKMDKRDKFESIN